MKVDAKYVFAVSTIRKISGCEHFAYTAKYRFLLVTDHLILSSRHMRTAKAQNFYACARIVFDCHGSISVYLQCICRTYACAWTVFDCHGSFGIAS